MDDIDYDKIKDRRKLLAKIAEIETQMAVISTRHLWLRSTNGKIDIRLLEAELHLYIDELDKLYNAKRVNWGVAHE